MRLVVDVEKAKELLIKNREQHLAEYDLQLEAWKVEYEKYGEALKVWSQAQGVEGSFKDRPHEPHKPNYFVQSYDKLIGKLSVHVEPTIQIESAKGYGIGEYEHIFENKFDWSSSFENITASYISTGSLSSDKLASAGINRAIVRNDD